MLLTRSWKAYKNQYLLKPVAWIYQICRYTRQIIATPNAFKSILVGRSEARKREPLMMNMGAHVLTIEERQEITRNANRKSYQKIFLK